MNRRLKPAALVVVLLLPVLIAFTGCAKRTGIERSEKATTTMSSVENNMHQAVAQIDVTSASLQNLVVAGAAPDLKTSFEIYSDNVKKMDDIGKTLIKDINEMSAQGNEYFEEWRKQGDVYTNPQIAKLSEERRVALRQTFSEIAEADVGVKGSLNQYLSDVKQIQTYLSNDLTPQGIAAIRPIAERTISEGNSLKNSFNPVQVAIDRAQAQMSAGGAAAGGQQQPADSPSYGMPDGQGRY
jgi:hypothetical protein